jgi:outer membrane receptor protein involved in Fe transport
VRTADQLSQGPLGAYTTGDVAFGIDFSQFSLEAFVSNIWDERAEIGKFQQCGVCTQRTYVTVNRPRTIGIRAGAKF